MAHMAGVLYTLLFWRTFSSTLKSSQESCKTHLRLQQSQAVRTRLRPLGFGVEGRNPLRVVAFVWGLTCLAIASTQLL